MERPLEVVKKGAFEVYTYAEFAACALAFLPIMTVVDLLHRDEPGRRVQGGWMRRFGRTTARLTPMWRFSVEGVPPTDILTKPYVVIANHESNADPFLLSFLPWDMRWIAKQELFDVPWIGSMMKRSGDIPLRRGNKGSVTEMHQECLRTLEAGVPIMIFPEGTRSKDGTLLPFKDGAFRLAIEAQVPILPIALHGTKDCMRKHSKRLGEARATARILSPMSTAGMTMDDLPRLRDRARKEIQTAVDRLAGRSPQTEPPTMFV